jgi:hypothetical protein
MSFQNSVRPSYVPTGQKGGYWGSSGGGCLRYLLILVVMLALVFTVIYFLD